MMKRKLLLLFVSLYAITVAAQQTYFPDADWQIKKPEELKMNKVLLDSVVSVALQSENKMERDLRIANMKSYSREPGYKIAGPMKERGGPAGLVIKNGYIVAQWGDINRVDMTFSATKSYLSTVAGLAIYNGLIKNVNDKVNQYVWTNRLKANIIQKSPGIIYSISHLIGVAVCLACTIGPTDRQKKAALMIGKTANCWNREQIMNTMMYV
jgi:hypothetical protein